VLSSAKLFRPCHLPLALPLLLDAVHQTRLFSLGREGSGSRCGCPKRRRWPWIMYHVLVPSVSRHCWPALPCWSGGFVRRALKLDLLLPLPFHVQWSHPRYSLICLGLTACRNHVLPHSPPFKATPHQQSPYTHPHYPTGRQFS